MSRVRICQGRWTHARSRICDSKKNPFYVLRPFYSTGKQPRRVQWVFHVHALDIINTVKTSETTGGNGRQG